ncbi:MAG: hypothetical protein AAFZ17_03090 [Cyanobacteria bacterium J06650_10]
MLAFQISVNSQRLCTVSSSHVVSVIALLKGDATVGGAEAPALSVSGMTRPDTHASWVNQELSAGDEITLEVVEVPESSLTAPTSVTQDAPDVIEKQQRAYYERLKAQYETPTP